MGVELEEERGRGDFAGVRSVAETAGVRDPAAFTKSTGRGARIGVLAAT